MTTEQSNERAVANGSPNGESQALLVIEDIDTEIIVADLEGRAISAWAYNFKGDDGKPVSGLTVAGVEQCSRESAKHGEALRIIKTDYQWLEQDGSWFAIIEVGRYAVREGGEAVLLDTAIGTKRERARKWSARRRRYYENENALDIAISKAARNAKNKLLDPSLRERVLQAALGSGKVVQATPQRQQRVAKEAQRDKLPPPSTDKVREDQARATFYQTAVNLGLTDDKGKASQEKIHERLRSVIGLACAKKATHGDPSDPGACHALREAVAKYAETTGPDKAAAWEYLTELLADDVMDDQPPGADGDAGEDASIEAAFEAEGAAQGRLE